MEAGLLLGGDFTSFRKPLLWLVLRKSHMQGQTTPALRVKENLGVEDVQTPAQDNPNSLL